MVFGSRLARSFFSAFSRSRLADRPILRLEEFEARTLPSTVTLRIAEYNIAASNGAPASGLDTILQAIGNEATYDPAQPLDLIALQEVQSQATTTQAVVNLLNAIYGANTYSRGAVNGTSTGAGTQGLVYRTSAVQLIGEQVVPNPGAERQPIRYQLKPVGAAASDEFYIYNSHYKANSTQSDQNERQAEAVAIRADADALGQGKNIIYAGDYNAYSASETFYATTLMGGGNGQAFDPVNRLGAWHDNSSFLDIFTQAPAVSPPNGLTGGGLDDRFDFQLVSGELMDGSGLDYKAGTYHTFGNNGSAPRNGDINNSSSTALSGLANRTTVLNFLTTVTDHLPVVADYTFSTVGGPTIGSFAVNPASIDIGDPISLTASNVSVVGGSVAAVNFYRESNGTAGLQIGSDTLVGAGTQNGTTWTLAASSAGLPAGTYTYYAIATDNSGNASAAASASLAVVSAAPTIGSFAVNPASINVGDPIALTASNVAVTSGSIAAVNFYRESNGTAGLQIGSDALVGAGAQNGNTWTSAATTTGLAVGSYTYYSVATDNSNNASAAATASLTIGNPVASGPILAWEVNGQSNYGTQGLAATLVAAGITNSLALTRGAGVGVTTGTGATGGWGGNTWSQTTSAAGATGNQFASFGFTVATGKVVSLASVDLNYRHSSTGPANGFWQFQINGGAWSQIGDFANQFSNATASGAAIAEMALSGIAGLQNITAGTTVVLRLVPYGATSSNGTWYVFNTTGSGNDLVLNGSIQNATVATTTSLSATPNATTGGTLVTFTAIVAPSPGALGTVNFIDGAATLAANVALNGGVATFQISSLELGTHHIIAVYSGAAGFAGSTSSTLDYSVVTAPQVVGVTVNGNLPTFAGAQRSRVVSMQVAFDRAVQLDAGAFAIALHANNVVFNGVAGPVGVVPANLVLSTTDNITWVVTFAGNTEPTAAPADGLNSLQDGVYDFKVVAAKVHPLGFGSVNAVADSTTVFDRLFGASTGATNVGANYSTTVETTENLAFRAAFNSVNSPGNTNYRPYFDFDGDGQVNTTDNLQFRNRFNEPLSWTE